MRILLRITLLGVFAIVGLALAVSVLLHIPPGAITASVQPIPSEKAAEAQRPLASLSPPVTVEISTPASTSPKSIPSEEDVRSVLKESIGRWSAEYLPAITRQFEEIEQAQEAVQKTQEQMQRTADELDKRKAEIAAPRPEELPPIQPPVPSQSPRPSPANSTVPEVVHDGAKDLVSVTAPNSDIREVLKTITDATGLNILATPSVTGLVSVSLTDVALDEALSAILKSSGFSSRREGRFIYVGTAAEIQNLSTANDQVGTRVFQPNYVTASELQKLFTPMLSKETGIIAISTASEVGIASSKDQAGGNTFAGNDVLLVRDYETVLCQMDEVFEEVDRMPAQVSIEAMILSVRLDDRNSLGVDFELLLNKENIRIVSGSPAPASLAELNFNDGLKVGFLDENLFAFVEALETIGDTNVIASPHVMCLNKQRAEILIGSELGYVSTTVTETAATQTVEFLEVGTHLRIRPFISDDGMVRLEVHPELSTGNVRVQGGFTLPDKDVTQVTTNIMCRSGATVILGGLIREDLVTNATQIPVLGNLPLLGTLFRQRTEDTERREIIVLLTPRILGEQEMYGEAQHASTQVRDRRNAFFDKMSPINKRRIGDRYYRLAVAAWAAGDADKAIRNANLAIHYDPLHQSSVDLRQEILAVYPDMEHGVHEHLRYGLWPWQHPVGDYSASTGWPWRDVGPVPPPNHTTPQDTGTPGRVRAMVSDLERDTLPRQKTARQSTTR